jgi:anti-anti-sigma factor
MEMRDSPSIIVRPKADGRQEMKLFGDMNVCLSAELHRECVQIVHRGQDAIVDCEGVHSFDAAALQILAALKDALTSQDRKFNLSGLSREQAETIGLAGLKQHLAVSDIP